MNVYSFALFVFCMSCFTYKFSVPLNNVFLKKADCKTSFYDKEVADALDTPLVVKRKIKEIVANSMTLDSIRVIDYDENIDIYSVKIKNYTNVLIYLIAHDKINNIVTQTPPFINGKWMENDEKGFKSENQLLTGELIHIVDLEGDNKPEIAIEERVHNGNIYNAVVSNFFAINKTTLELKLLLALENKYKYIFEDKCMINRKIEGNCIVVEKKYDKSAPVLIGRIFLKIKNGQTKIVKKEIYESEYKEIIVTGSGLKDKIFIKNGYKYLY